MESNYIKSARIKLQKLGITDYEAFKKSEHEIFKIVYETMEKELDLKSSLIDIGHNSSFVRASSFMPGYGTFVDACSIPEKKPWELQTLEYYTRTPSNFIKDFVEE